jgi:hypothetical protein
MNAEFLRGFLRAGMFITVVSLVLVFTSPQDSAEFVVSMLSLIIGLALLGMVTFAIWLARK